MLTPFPEKGTQKRRIFHKGAKGIQAGTNPEEKDRAVAVVVESREGEGEERGGGGRGEGRGREGGGEGRERRGEGGGEERRGREGGGER